ncbi:MAG: DUF2652 domain-containing protein [Bacteroidota bacterium]
MSQDQASLIFIPDITGFTQFVNQTEIKHGQHIISELLEIIINSNKLGLLVAEIEGDAVLFYLEKQLPTVDQLIDQAKEMFVNFHNHLLDYETRRICRCGACTSASQLSLKFIAHTGKIGFITVHGKSKPYGAEIVTSHRLLKNDIDAAEYILFSESFRPLLQDFKKEMLTFQEGSKEYPDIGLVRYTYSVLTPYREFFSKSKAPAPPPKVKKPLIKRIHIERPVSEVYSTLMDLDLRLLWNEGLDKLEFKQDRVNRVGTRHTCLFPVGEADFTTVIAEFEADSRVYGEELEDPPFGRQLIIYYILSPEGEQTELRTELHFFPKPIIGWVMGPLLKFKFAKQLAKTLEALKKLSENHVSEPAIVI